MRNKNITFFSLLIVTLLTAGSNLIAQTVTVQNAASVRQALVDGCKKYVGAPYAYGAIGPDSFDCSGFIFTASRESTGVQLPRTVKALYSFVQVIPQNQLEAGDIVFFRTTADGSISHAGIYIGNNQFMHAVSDGPNTGVIVSSLKEATWKRSYAGSGRFLPTAAYSGNSDSANTDANGNPSNASSVNAAAISGTGAATGAAVAGTDNKAENSKSAKPNAKNTSLSAEEKDEIREKAKKAKSNRNSKKKSSEIVSKLTFDAFAGVDWALFTSSRFNLNFRGVPVMANLRFKDWPLEPGLYTGFRFNTGVDAFQLPIAVSITPNEYFRCYAGPVVTFGTPELPGGDDEEIKASVFPGIIGVSWTTPSFTKGKVKVSLCQDISYSVFNKKDGSALSPKDSFASGLLFSTGIRVTLPFAIFFK